MRKMWWELLCQPKVWLRMGVVAFLCALLGRAVMLDPSEDAKASHAVTRVSYGDTLSTLFHQQHLSQQAMLAVLGLGEAVDPLRRLRPGQELRWVIDGGKLTHLVMPIDQKDLLVISHDAAGYRARQYPLQKVSRTRPFSLDINDTLYQSASRSGLSKWLADKLISIFKDRINLIKASKAGDRIWGVIEEVNLGEGYPKLAWVVYSHLQRGERVWSAARYVDHRGRVGYYQADGHNVHVTFAQYPLQFKRVSSPFDYHRYNPVLHRYLPHLGIDLAAPRGTPIHATADGVVKFAGMNGGYGKEVVIRHEGGIETRYGHMSKIAKLKKGQAVKRGQVIGYVGSTGRSTGPHLHYEVRKQGKPYNPQKVKLPAGHSLFGDDLRSFKKWWKSWAKREAQWL